MITILLLIQGCVAYNYILPSETTQNYIHNGTCPLHSKGYGGFNWWKFDNNITWKLAYGIGLEPNYSITHFMSMFAYSSQIQACSYFHINQFSSSKYDIQASHLALYRVCERCKCFLASVHLRSEGEFQRTIPNMFEFTEYSQNRVRVLSTDYTSFIVLYGCRDNMNLSRFFPDYNQLIYQESVMILFNVDSRPRDFQIDEMVDLIESRSSMKVNRKDVLSLFDVNNCTDLPNCCEHLFNCEPRLIDKFYLVVNMNGYKFNLHRLTNCNGSNAVMVADQNITASMNKKCDVSVIGCMTSLGFQTAKVTYLIIKNGAKLAEGTKDACKEMDSASDELKAVFRILAFPEHCPVNKGRLCSDETKPFSLAKYKNMMGMAKGKILVKLFFEFDGDRTSCFEIETEIAK